jgi:hypothetical protein
MKRQWLAAITCATVSLLGVATYLAAAPPWQTLIPFRKVDADPNKDYRLTEDQGPWLIMCRSFAGQTAEQDARALVLELRQEFKMKAYLHDQEYDFTKKEIGKGFDEYGGPKVMKPANATKFQEIAVLVGDFHSPEDPKLDDALEKIKYARPACLDIRSGQGTSQRYWGVRIASRAKVDKTDGKGPMRMAFLTRNPLLPDEYFQQKGIDPLVKNMNKGLKYSLLKNPGKYTVRVATFRGNTATTVRAKDYERLSNEELRKSKLEEGAIKAGQLVQALREDGFEAYEFHDLHESIVTIGNFNSVGEPRPDGKIEINPAMLAIIDRFKATETQIPGQGKSLGAQKYKGISLDIQPLPVAVPKDSIGAAYARGRE